VNHFVGLVILSIAVALVFALINKDMEKERLRYFLTLIGYMIGGSFVFAWIMYWIGS